VISSRVRARSTNLFRRFGCHRVASGAWRCLGEVGRSPRVLDVLLQDAFDRGGLETDALGLGTNLDGDGFKVSLIAGRENWIEKALRHAGEAAVMLFVTPTPNLAFDGSVASLGAGAA